MFIVYLTGTAAIARAFTPYFDSLTNDSLSNFFQHYVPLNVPTFSAYADLLALAITLALTGAIRYSV